MSLALPQLASRSAARRRDGEEGFFGVSDRGRRCISPDGRYDSLFLNNYATINLLDKIGSMPGVGDTRLAAQQNYGMRVWINPDKMAKLGLTATDVTNAIQAQNRQNPAGVDRAAARAERHGFPVSGERARASARSAAVRGHRGARRAGRFAPACSRHRPHRAGRARITRPSAALNGVPRRVLIVYLSPGANAVETATACRRSWKRPRRASRPGFDYMISYDATQFVRASIKDVVQTLFEAVGLVILVVFVFLQNWRATLIPLLTVPVSILGTFALFPLLGFSINMTSMFGLVLAIGIVVDDAIVVVEAVQLNIDHGMPPREATIRAMQKCPARWSRSLVFWARCSFPWRFWAASRGQIYRQFALTIAASVLISAFSALSLSPALCAMILRPTKESHGLLARLLPRASIAAFDWTTNRYLGGVRVLIRRSVLALVALAAFYRRGGGLCSRCFPPDSCQTRIRAYFRGGAAAGWRLLERNAHGRAQVEKIFALDSRSRERHRRSAGSISRRRPKIRTSRPSSHSRPWEERDDRRSQFAASWRRPSRNSRKSKERYRIRLRAAADPRAEQRRRIRIHAGGSRGRRYRAACRSRADACGCGAASVRN